MRRSPVLKQALLWALGLGRVPPVLSSFQPPALTRGRVPGALPRGTALNGWHMSLALPLASAPSRALAMPWKSSLSASPLEWLSLHFPLAVVTVLVAGGFAAEIVAAISRRAFLRLQAPPMRVCGCDTPFPLVFEPVYIPSAQRVYDAIVASATF